MMCQLYKRRHAWLNTSYCKTKLLIQDRPRLFLEVSTPAYYNPHQSIKLFSPQSHFFNQPKKRGAFVLTCAHTYLNVPKQGNVPLVIDKTTFMLLFSCFCDVDKVVNNLANPCVTDETNPLLHARSKLLLKFHYKFNHLGF